MLQELRGRTLGPYRIERELFSIGAVRVCLGAQVALGRHVVIKALPLDPVDNAREIERFRREAAAIARLRHPHIVTVHDFGYEDGLAYTVSELVDGVALADRLGQPTPFLQTYLIVSQIASAIDFAHSRGVVHRNICPDTILLIDRDGQRTGGTGAAHPWVMVSDFSLAKIADPPALTAEWLSHGAPYYMSPEQVAGNPGDRPTDIYSLAIVAFELLTGAVPFAGSTVQEVAQKHTHEMLPSARLVVPDLPPALDRVLQKAAAKNPGERYVTATEFADAFARAGGLEPAGREASGMLANEFAPANLDDDDDEAPTRQEPPWLIPVAGAAAGLVVLCVAVVCAVNFVVPNVTRALGLAPTPSPTATVTPRPQPTGTPSGVNAGAPITRTVGPGQAPTATPQPGGPQDRQAVEAAIRESNEVWAAAVGPNGDTSRLNTVFGGAWLNTITAQVNTLRANRQYRQARLRELRIDDIQFTGANRATVRTTENWDDTLRSE
ncbi:MAG: protein kinase, partial [Dehalococcoidia bacterium]|nr:protein kinase [Dehalococcoidia bacterium]